MTVVRVDALAGGIDNSGTGANTLLSSGGPTVLKSAALNGFGASNAGAPTLTAGQVIPISFYKRDPVTGAITNREDMVLTAFTAGQGSSVGATLARAQNGTTAQMWIEGVDLWQHGWRVEDATNIGVDPLLAPTGVGAGTYGTTNALPILTIAADGRVHTVTTAGIVPVVNAADPQWGGLTPETYANCLAGTPAHTAANSATFAAAYAAAVTATLPLYVPPGNYALDPYVAQLWQTTNATYLIAPMWQVRLWHFDPNAHGPLPLISAAMTSYAFWQGFGNQLQLVGPVAIGIVVDGTWAPGGSIGLDYGPGVYAQIQARAENYQGYNATASTYPTSTLGVLPAGIIASGAPSTGFRLRTGQIASPGTPTSGGWCEESVFLHGSWASNCTVGLDIAPDDGQNSYHGTVLEHFYARQVNGGQVGVRMGRGRTHAITSATVSLGTITWITAAPVNVTQGVAITVTGMTGNVLFNGTFAVTSATSSGVTTFMTSATSSGGVIATGAADTSGTGTFGTSPLVYQASFNVEGTGGAGADVSIGTLHTALTAGTNGQTTLSVSGPASGTVVVHDGMPLRLAWTNGSSQIAYCYVVAKDNGYAGVSLAQAGPYSITVDTFNVPTPALGTGNPPSWDTTTAVAVTSVDLLIGNRSIDATQFVTSRLDLTGEHFGHAACGLLVTGATINSGAICGPQVSAFGSISNNIDTSPAVTQNQINAPSRFLFSGYVNANDAFWLGNASLTQPATVNSAGSAGQLIIGGLSLRNGQFAMQTSSTTSPWQVQATALTSGTAFLHSLSAGTSSAAVSRYVASGTAYSGDVVQAAMTGGSPTGNLFNGLLGSTPKFTVNGSGNLTAAGTLSAAAGQFTVDASGNSTSVVVNGFTLSLTGPVSTTAGGAMTVQSLLIDNDGQLTFGGASTGAAILCNSRKVGGLAVGTGTNDSVNFGQMFGNDLTNNGTSGASVTSYDGGTAFGAMAAKTATAAGDLSGTWPTLTVAKVNGVALSAAQATLLSQSSGTTTLRPTGSMPSTAAAGETSVLTGSTASQTLTLPTAPADGTTNRVLNYASVSVTLSRGGSTDTITFSNTSASTLTLDSDGTYALVYNATNTTWYLITTTHLPYLTGTLTTGHGGTGGSNKALIANHGISSGALSTTTFASGTGKQVDTTCDRIVTLVAAATLATDTVAVALSPDNVTYTTLATVTPGVASTGAWQFSVPAAWFMKVTVTGSATITASSVYY